MRISGGACLRENAEGLGEYRTTEAPTNYVICHGDPIRELSVLDWNRSSLHLLIVDRRNYLADAAYEGTAGSLVWRQPFLPVVAVTREHGK